MRYSNNNKRQMNGLFDEIKKVTSQVTNIVKDTGSFAINTVKNPLQLPIEVAQTGINVVTQIAKNPIKGVIRAPVEMTLGTVKAVDSLINPPKKVDTKTGIAIPPAFIPVEIPANISKKSKLPADLQADYQGLIDAENAIIAMIKKANSEKKSSSSLLKSVEEIEDIKLIYETLARVDADNETKLSIIAPIQKKLRTSKKSREEKGIESPRLTKYIPKINLFITALNDATGENEELDEPKENQKPVKTTLTPEESPVLKYLPIAATAAALFLK